MRHPFPHLSLSLSLSLCRGYIYQSPGLINQELFGKNQECQHEAGRTRAQPARDPNTTDGGSGDEEDRTNPGLDVPELALLSDRTMESACSEVGLSTAETAIVEVARARKAHGDSGASALEALRLQLELSPGAKGAHHRKKNYVADLSTEELKKRSLEIAKEGQMSAVENPLLFTALHASEEDRRLVAAIVCCENDADRTAMFNFHLSECKGEAFLAQHGPTLAALQVPLFPDTAEYDLLNAKLLREYAYTTAVGGATPGWLEKNSVFRRHRGGDTGAGLHICCRHHLTGSSPTTSVQQRIHRTEEPGRKSCTSVETTEREAPAHGRHTRAHTRGDLHSTRHCRSTA